MLNLVEISQRLRHERLKLGLNQDAFAGLVGASLQTQTRYETGSHAPKLDYLFKLREHGVDIAYILTGVRADGSINLIEQSLLNDFNHLTMDQKAVVSGFIAIMAGRPPMSPDQFFSQSQRQTLHSPKSNFSGQPPNFSISD